MKLHLTRVRTTLAFVGCMVASLVIWTGAASQSTPAATSAQIKTPWGEPDLQGIWSDTTETPLERPAKYANKEFFTEEERARLDKERAQLLGRDKRAERGTIADVA